MFIINHKESSQRSIRLNKLALNTRREARLLFCLGTRLNGNDGLLTKSNTRRRFPRKEIPRIRWYLSKQPGRLTYFLSLERWKFPEHPSNVSCTERLVSFAYSPMSSSTLTAILVGSLQLRRKIIFDLLLSLQVEDELFGGLIIVIRHAKEDLMVVVAVPH